MALSQSYFKNARGCTVNGGQFFNIGQINKASNNDPVSTTLWQHVAASAISDSAERFPPAKCHPGTRERIIEKIVEWIEKPTPNQRILWLYGPAGSGKSALSQTICERYKDRCKGSFFFARGLTDRGKAFKLFATLSYQLALQIPSMRAALNEALYHDPSLPTKSMETQLFTLIIQPLLHCTPLPEHSPVLIIDGLDECADDQGMDTQSGIITLISKAIVEYDLPLRFLIASRPESWIRDTFESSPLHSITLSLSLRDDIDADKDIKAYLTDGFEKIRMENKRIMGSVTLPWPPTKIVERFVYEASGQYIYASTVLKFVGQFSKHNNPQQQLLFLTTPGPDRALAFSELDRLYERILSSCLRRTAMKRVLGGILARANLTVIEKILLVDPTELSLVLDALSSLINVELPPPPTSPYEVMLESIYGSLTNGREKISLCHLSFREFLEDETRSQTFHIDVRDIAEEITRAFFGIIHRNITQNYATEPHLSFDVGLATYQHMMSTMACDCSECLPDFDIDTLRGMIDATTNNLLLLDPDVDMEYFGSFMADMELLRSMFIQSSDEYFWVSPQTHQYEPDEFGAYDHAVWKLKDAARLARKRCIHLLSSYRRFTVTPTLAYLHEFYTRETVSVDEIFSIGHTVADVLSTLRQHRHIIMFNGHIELRLGVVCLDEYNELFDNKSADENHGDEGWRTRGEWRHYRISILSEKLNDVLDDVWGLDLYKCCDYVGLLFKSRNLSDIRTRNYFQQPCNLSILASMSDFSAWTSLLNKSWYPLVEMIVPVLCWFHRQLMSATTLHLLDDHDKNLVSRMRATMNQIFEHLFLPEFTRSCHSKLYVSSFSEKNGKAIKMNVLPLPQGYHKEEIPYVDREGLWSSVWRDFHDEVFRKVLQPQECPPTIDPQCWHPHLASCLLNALATDVWRRADPAVDLYLNDSRREDTKESFAYIVECLPYAETTQQNLDSLRVIAYFFPWANLDWDPPIEFWYLSVEFLRKYDRSILSEDELNQFEWWMYSMGRYMKRYRPVVAQESSILL